MLLAKHLSVLNFVELEIPVLQACKARGGEEEVVIIYSWTLGKISQIRLKCPEKIPKQQNLHKKILLRI